ncbi:MAG: hypothetical protein HY720_28690 [Planctomycetes bacterium]|nr:hypothetical protein [Planctomycetota bacterium]
MSHRNRVSPWALVPPVIFAIGVALYVMGLPSGTAGRATAFWLTVFFWFGMERYAIDKGRSRWWSLLSLASIFGWITLAFLPVRENGPRVLASRGPAPAGGYPGTATSGVGQAGPGAIPLPRQAATRPGSPWRAARWVAFAIALLAVVGLAVSFGVEVVKKLRRPEGQPEHPASARRHSLQPEGDEPRPPASRDGTDEPPPEVPGPPEGVEPRPPASPAPPTHSGTDPATNPVRSEPPPVDRPAPRAPDPVPPSLRLLEASCRYASIEGGNRELEISATLQGVGVDAQGLTDVSLDVMVLSAEGTALFEKNDCTRLRRGAMPGGEGSIEWRTGIQMELPAQPAPHEVWLTFRDQIGGGMAGTRVRCRG